MRGLRGGQIKADRGEYRDSKDEGAIGGGTEGQDRCLFCYVVGFECCLQYL